MASTNPAALHILVPDYPLDQIIGYFTGTATVPAPSLSPGFTTVTQTFQTNFGDSCYFQGIFSTDNGVTWNDFGSQTPNLAPPFPQFQTLDVNAVSGISTLTVTLTNTYDLSHTIGIPYTATFKVYALAKNTMAQSVSPLPTNQILSFSSPFNFQQIDQQGTVSLNVAGGITGSTIVVHNLGYVPIVRAFQFAVATPTVCQPISTGFIADPQVELTTSTLTFFSDQGNGSGINTVIDYRIYRDNVN